MDFLLLGYAWCYSEAYWDLAEESQTDTITSQKEHPNSERGNKTSENIRYGEAISEHGLGGETTTSGGEAKQGRYWSFRQVFMVPI